MASKRITIAICVLLAIPLLAQERSIAPTLTEVEARDVIITQLNQRIVELQTELMKLQIILDKQQRTPPAKDGYVWNWTLNQETQQPIGYVKAAPPKTAEK